MAVVTIRPNSQNWKDTAVYGDNPAAIIQNEVVLRVGNTAGALLEILMKFELTEIPANAKINSVLLYMYQDSNYYTINPRYANVYPITAAWDITTTNFNNKPPYDSKVAYGTLSLRRATSGQYQAVNITSLVKEWHNGTRVNHGLVITQGTQFWDDNDRAQYYSSESSPTTSAPYLVVDYTVDGKIKDQVPGTVINFAGSTWTILDPATGYLFKNESIAAREFDPDMTKVFDPKDINNIGYYLNTTYYNTLPATDKTMIQSRNWGIQGLTTAQGGILDNTPTLSVNQMKNVENGLTVPANIGMLSVSEWRRYSLKYGNGALLNPPNDMWCRAQVYGYTDYVVWFVNTSGSVNIRDAHTNLSVHPTLYINPETNIVNGTVVYNAVPTITVNTLNNLTLYENDTFNIDGTVSDADIGNTVTVRYQIEAGTVRAIKAFVSTGAAESFGKQLRFSGGNLYDGDTLIASNLTDGVAHTLKVYATDDQGGTSQIIERTFYVVPNRAPSLSVNTPVISGNIDNDEFEITGSFNDLDKNTTTVSYRINGGNSVQVAEGTGGDFNFKVKFGQLKVGLNSIVIEAIDSYGAKTSRTVKLNKNEVKTEQLKSTARFKIYPPLTTAKGIVLWVRRDENLTLSASISMTQAAEAENFVPMTKSRTAPMANMVGVVEDQFEYGNATPADKVLLQLDMQRSSLTANEKIYLLVGVID